jgi:hypothetical protein
MVLMRLSGFGGVLKNSGGWSPCREASLIHLQEYFSSWGICREINQTVEKPHLFKFG